MGFQEAAFALLINGKESYVKSMNKYIGDSFKLEKKLCLQEII